MFETKKQDDDVVKNENAKADTTRPKNININVPDFLRAGAYADNLQIMRAPHDLILDFSQSVPSGDPSVAQLEVVSRVRIAPTMLPTIVNQLSKQLEALQQQAQEQLAQQPADATQSA